MDLYSRMNYETRSEYSELSFGLREIVFMALIVLTENMFYMLNRNNLRVIYDLKQFVGLAMIGLFIFYLPNIVRSKFLFKKILLLIASYYVFSIFNAYISIGQSLKEGVYSLMIPGMILVYFFMCFLIEERDRFNKFKQIYIHISVFAGIIYMLQSLLYPSVVFLSVEFKERLGNVRFIEFVVFMNFAMFLTLNELLKKNEAGSNKNKAGSRSKTLYYILALCVQSFSFLVIAQSRLQFMITFVLIIFAMLFLQEKLSKSIVVLVGFIVFFALISSVIYYNMDSFTITESYVYETFEDIRHLSGNLGTRIRTVGFYTKNLKGHLMFGWGSLNIGNHDALVISGRKFGYYLVDLGLLGYMYQYGLVGVLLTLSLTIKAIMVSWVIYRRNKKVFYPLLCSLSVLINGIMIYYYQESYALFYLGMLLVFIEYEYRIALKEDQV